VQQGTRRQRASSRVPQLTTRCPFVRLLQTYWLLLAISEDNPRDEHVSMLRDACEQAALEGHWVGARAGRLPSFFFSFFFHFRPQACSSHPLLCRCVQDLPFKDAKLPPPNPRSQLHRFLRLRQLQQPSDGAGTPGSGGTPEAVRGISIDGLSPERAGPRFLEQWDGEAMSPELSSRPTSPDGLGGGIYSSVFMDTGVEGLMSYEEPSPQEGLSDAAQPPPPSAALRDGAAGGSVQRSAGSLSRLSRLSFTAAREGDADVVSPAWSPPTSPRRRETTFGATLDLVEALCTASSNLTAFQREDHRRLRLLAHVLHSYPELTPPGPP